MQHHRSISIARVLTMLLGLALSSLACADNGKTTADQKRPQHAANSETEQAPLVTRGKLHGLQRASITTNGAVVVHYRLSGQGDIEAAHVIIDGELSPGHSPGCINFGGYVTFNASASLFIEIGGPAPCTGYDQINVANTLTINGAAFQLALLSPYVPQYGDSFNVINWGTLSGSGFGSMDTSMAVLPYPYQWDLSQLLVTGEITVGVIHLADGDLAPWNNPDGDINAADLMIATQLALGQRTPDALQYAHGDMNNDGVINVADMLLINQLVLQN